jgi:8-oxo-dGTP pyrophosphatase MutT (NUDIX family)
MELLDVYDAQRRRTGQVLPRSAAPEIGYLLVTHVCLFNSRGEMLIQRRQPWKDRYPDCWDLSAGGFVQSGETSAQAALRELEEELGLQLRETELAFLFTEPFSYVLDDFYLARTDAAAAEFCPQPEEVAEVKWAAWPEVRAMLQDGGFVDYDGALLRRIFRAAE